MKETIWTNVPVILVVSANYRGWEGGISIVKSSRPRIDTLIVVLTVKTEEANTITTVCRVQWNAGTCDVYLGYAWLMCLYFQVELRGPNIGRRRSQ